MLAKGQAFAMVMVSHQFLAGDCLRSGCMPVSGEAMDGRGKREGTWKGLKSIGPDISMD